MASPATQLVPIRHASTMSANSDDAIPSTGPLTTTDLLEERLRAWKHAVAYLEDYVTATEKVEKAHAKEYEKVLKSIANPLREGHHFDQNLGGIAGLFENMRVNTQGIINSHLETEKNLKGSVLPILERLHKEIKNKSKELTSGASKSAKEVEKARNTTQKHIELLSTQTTTYISHGGKINATDDPYVVHRGIYHRLNKQVLEENNCHNDLISVQSNFQTFEQHVVEVLQQAIGSFNQFIGGQCEKDRNMYQDILATVQRIPPMMEWTGFVGRSQHLLVDPDGPLRSVDNITFPNQNHQATQPLVEGTLERKSRNKLSMGGYSTGYYVVTPSKYLHEFKDNDNFRKDPTPELSIYLPDATIGAVAGEKFNIKGKDVSGGLSSKLSGSPEVAFKAHTPADAQKWYEVIRSAAGNGPASGSESPNPISRTNTGITMASQAAGPVASQLDTKGASVPVFTEDQVRPAGAPPVDKKG